MIDRRASTQPERAAKVQAFFERLAKVRAEQAGVRTDLGFDVGPCPSCEAVLEITRVPARQHVVGVQGVELKLLHPAPICEWFAVLTEGGPE